MTFMRIEAQKRRYYGDAGWKSDPALFAQVAVTWKQWIGQSGEHLYAAQVLLPHVQQRNLEIKSMIEKTQRIPKVLLGHDLIELARKAEFKGGTDEEYTLAFLSRYGTWAGRYPLPVKNTDYAITNKLSDGNHYVVAAHNPDDVHRFSEFAGMLYSWAREKVEKRAAETKEATST